jgi:hypothetical protein
MTVSRVELAVMKLANATTTITTMTVKSKTGSRTAQTAPTKNERVRAQGVKDYAPTGPCGIKTMSTVIGHLAVLRKPKL